MIGPLEVRRRQHEPAFPVQFCFPPPADRFPGLPAPILFKIQPKSSLPLTFLAAPEG